jgi:chemotaxis signal transduction protein
VAQNHDGESMPRDSPAERILVFRLEDELHAIRVNDIGGVVSCEGLRALPGAPAGVLGVAEWRGSVLTVLDLSEYLGRAAPDEPACLIRLAPPLEQTALYLRATVQLPESRLEPPATADPEGEKSGWTCGDEPVCLIDPREIVLRLETKMREST